MKRIGVVLNGRGMYDDGKIHEAVITPLAIARNDVQTVCSASGKPQHGVINHLTGEPLTEQRGVLMETARIARGDILPLTQARAETLDALIAPGDFDTAKNLSSFVVEDSECQVDRGLQVLTLAIYQTDRPLGLMCIAPVLLPKIFAFPLRITIGTDFDAADVAEGMGAEYVPCSVDDVVVDEKSKMVTTPAYMLAENIVQVATGVEKLIAHVLAPNA